MDNRGILVYCVANKLDNRISDITGLDGKNKLYAVNSEDYYAIASDVGLDEYGEDAMADKGEDINWLKEKASVFMDIVLRVGALSDIIPMKFLTIFTTEDRVKGVVSENLKKFRDNFEKIRDREELSLKIYCDDKVYKETTLAKEVADFDKTLEGKPKGAAFFLKKKFESELNDKIQSRICTAANSIADRLKVLAAEMKSGKILAKEITGVDTTMILNCSFLIGADMKEQFLKSAVELSAEYDKLGFLMDLSGPWPPYDFCD